MKKNYLKIVSLALVAALSFNVKAADPVADMMRSGADDFLKFAGLQLTPLGNSFAAGLGGGWYNTAKSHKLLGFDLTVSLNMATIPDADKTFDFAAQNFQALSLASGTNAQVPTLIAYDDVTPVDMVLKTKAQNVNVPLPNEITSLPAPVLAAFKSGVALPSGATISGNNIVFAAPATQLGDKIQIKGLVPKAIPFVAIPTPTAQLGIGLVFGTDIIIRYMPTLGSGDFKIGLWGVGVKHDIKQWIPVVKDLPFFDLSALVGYTKMTTTYGLSVLPSLYGTNVVSSVADNFWSGQEMAVGASALTGQVMISKGLLLNIFTPYIGLGFTSTSFNIDMNGKYPLVKSAISKGISPVSINLNAANPAASTVTTNPAFDKLYVDGVTKGTDYMEPGQIVNSSVFMPNATIGLRLKLLILTIHAQYTLQKYSMFSAGVGFAIR
jgi:hypothetical protein